MKGIALLLAFGLVGTQQVSARSLSEEQLNTFNKNVKNHYNVYNTDEGETKRLQDSVKQALMSSKRGGHLENNKLEKPYNKKRDWNIYENGVDMNIFAANIPIDQLSRMNGEEPLNNAGLDFVNINEDNYFDYISDEIGHRFFDDTNEHIGDGLDVQETSAISEEDILENRINVEKLQPDHQRHAERNEFSGNENANFDFALEKEEEEKDGAYSNKEFNNYIIDKLMGQLGDEEGWESYKGLLQEEQDKVESRKNRWTLVNGKNDLFELNNEIENHVNQYEEDENVYSWDFMESEKNKRANVVGKKYKEYNDEENEEKNDINFGVFEYLANNKLEGDNDDRKIYTDLDSSDLNVDYFQNDYLEDLDYDE